MCGIIGIIGREPAAPRLLEALKRLEYRGYDSAGVAVLKAGGIERRRAAGKISRLEAVLRESPLAGRTGIGHTRWATHGAPNEANAHPHATARVAIVHNGIIENFKSLRDMAIADGARFESETDSEVIAQLIDMGLRHGKDPVAAAMAAIDQLKGAFAVACLFAGDEDLLIGARKGSPMVAGLGEDGELFLGSDAIAVAPFTTRIIYLEEGDFAVLRQGGVEVFDSERRGVARPVTVVSSAIAAVEKGNYRHYMQKEILEQPETIGRTLSHYVDGLAERVALPELEDLDLTNVAAVDIVACGTASYAGRVAEYWLETIAGVRAECDIASEFRYRNPVIAAGDLAIFISQSGETADTLAALRYAKERGARTLGVVNVPRSSIWRETAHVMPTVAGPEIGVASTKAFTAQLAALAALSLAIGRARGALEAEAEREHVRALLETPRLVAEAIAAEPEIASLAAELSKARDVLYLGRGAFYPMALEGALKLKEISYIHAEGYAAGELKHGPIALIDENMPVIVAAPHDALFEKTLSNMQEVAARGGKLILISDADGHAATADLSIGRVLAPRCHPFVAPIVYAAPLQLIAYHVAVHKGTDVDQPRNLAKSVTVE